MKISLTTPSTKVLFAIAAWSILAVGCTKHEGSEVFALEQAKQDAPFCAEHIPPLKGFVENYRIQNGRLPTKEAFTAWVAAHREYKAVWFFPERPHFATNWGKGGQDYCLAVWRGEDVVFWQSWDEKTFRRATPE